MGCCPSKKTGTRLPRASKPSEVVIPLHSTKDTKLFPEKTQPTQISETERPLPIAKPTKDAKQRAKVKVPTTLVIPSAEGLAVEPPVTSRTQVTINTTQEKTAVPTAKTPSIHLQKQQEEWKKKVRKEFAELTEKTQDHAEEIDETDCPTPSTVKENKMVKVTAPVKPKKQTTVASVTAQSSIRQFDPTQEEQPASSLKENNTIKSTPQGNSEK
ncbi:hypothetical protein M3Y94_00625300 [Aphelenchoides besseyi]|nr:hypothetical protein M3Y94_00625300 [Aphelenchoides besseyi]KAI6218966.1 hypothetical protein M3Y95_01144400 [Aphelenchoides besseyi]